MIDDFREVGRPAVQGAHWARPLNTWLPSALCLAVAGIVCVAGRAFPAESSQDGAKEEFRTWIDKSGGHRVVAALLRVEEGKAWLKREDGKEIAVPLEKLSEPDRKYLRDRARGGAGTDDQAKDDAPNTPALLKKGGAAWSSLDRYTGFQTKVVAGNRFWIWPVEDAPFAVDDKWTMKVKLHWRLRPGQEMRDAERAKPVMLGVTILAGQEGTKNPAKLSHLQQVRLADAPEGTIEVSVKWKPDELRGTGEALLHLGPLPSFMEDMVQPDAKTPDGAGTSAPGLPRPPSGARGANRNAASPRGKRGQPLADPARGGLLSDSSERAISNLLRVRVDFTRPNAPRPAGPGGIQLLRVWHHSAIVLNARFLDEGDEVLSTDGDGTVRLWDVKSGEAKGAHRIARPPDPGLRQIATAPIAISDVAFLPGGRRWLVRERDEFFFLWDKTSNRVIEQIHTAVGTGCLAFCVQRDKLLYLYSPGSHPGRLVLADLKTGKPLRNFDGHTDRVYHAKFCSDGQRLLTISNSDRDSSVRWWDAATGKLLWTHSKPGLRVYSAALSNDGAKALLLGTEGVFLDVETGKELHSARLPAVGFAGALVGDGSRALIVSEGTPAAGSAASFQGPSRILKLIDTRGFRPLAEQAVEDANPSERDQNVLVVSPDGRYCLSFDGGKLSVQKDRGRKLRLWQLPP